MAQPKLYGWRDAEASHMHKHFMPHLIEMCGPLSSETRILDVGCGNGFTVGFLLQKGCNVVGIDASPDGIEIAKRTYPQARFEILSAENGNILSHLNCEPFDIVVSTEVMEHVYDPHAFARCCYHALRPGGRFICSTPYHGYLKNLVLACFNRWDRHANPLWLGGHIKFWSRKTLSQLLTDTGFANLRFRGAGRLPFLWMTMLMAADRPISEIGDQRSGVSRGDSSVP
jgi:2-polyprenyl-3-methyl-5-hydroxy-6-metoxy-1,4-benzoquinol methylase